ncbi:MAG TPA: penicillin-binding protein activator LpoB [Cryomorphaceae bacterium]|nr:penicillin-binding protein activator LpoB [Cryomorphaceae bacterium]
MKSNFFLVAALCIGIASCNSTKKVTRVDEGEQIDLSGRWNDTDSRLVANEMVQDALSRPWLGDHMQDAGKKPSIIVGLVKNKTSEHIATETFINDIERAFINSGRVNLVQGGEFRNDLRAEKLDQQDNASMETVKRFGREMAADYIMQGTVSSITDSDGRTKLVFYQTDLSLTNIETNQKVWIGDKKIKKVVE